MTFTKTDMQHGRGSSYPHSKSFTSDGHRNSNPMESYLCLLHAQPCLQIFCYLLYLQPPRPRKRSAQGGKMAMREVSSCLGKTLVLLPAGRCSFTTRPNWGTARGGGIVDRAAGISCLSEHSWYSRAVKPACTTRQSDGAWVAEDSAVRTAITSPGHIPGCLLALPHFSQCILSSSRSHI